MAHGQPSPMRAHGQVFVPEFRTNCHGPDGLSTAVAHPAGQRGKGQVTKWLLWEGSFPNAVRVGTSTVPRLATDASKGRPAPSPDPAIKAQLRFPHITFVFPKPGTPW